MSFVAILDGKPQLCPLAQTDAHTFPVSRKLQACPEAQPPLENKHNRFWSNYQDVYTTWANRNKEVSLRQSCDTFVTFMPSVCDKLPVR
jgi:hypothetical protein